MASTNRTAVYLEPKLHRALKRQAASSDQSISELVNEAVRESLREDARDVAIASRRLRQAKRISYEKFLQQLKQDGRL
ncbi:MAG: CopG family transcriptional regulator [Candidatus Acidiferrales bacterium]